MVTKMLSLLLLLLFAITPMACQDVSSDKDGRRDEPRKKTTVGGSKGVVVEHGGGQGTEVKVGGDKGVVVETGSGQGTEVKIGGDKGVVVEH